MEGGNVRRMKKRKRISSSSATDVNGKEDPNAAGCGTYHCNYCGRNIPNVRVKCAVCVDFDLCLECFSVGVELGEHKNMHAYSIVDKMEFPLFHLEWTAAEELLLLEAIDVCGLGNWVDISEYIGTKDVDQCEKHWFDTYVRTPTFPLPPMNETITTPCKPRKAVKRTKIEKASHGGASQPTSHESGLMFLRKEFEVCCCCVGR
jgi:transcriptional adapter 2-alpha